MSKIKEYRFEILIFIVEAVCMILEIVASRVLSPYFGSSNVIWTSVIAIILLSSSIGNYFGGKVADSPVAKQFLCFILGGASFFIFIIANSGNNIVSFISGLIENLKIGAILSTGLLFLIPSVLFGMIPPIILKIKLKNIEDAGKTAGRITAISTVGGIIGTVLGGFWLVPNIGSVHILYVLSVISLLLIFLIGEKLGQKTKIAFFFFALIAVIFMTLSITKNISNEIKVLNKEFRVEASYDTEYSRILIYNSKLITRRKH